MESSSNHNTIRRRRPRGHTARSGKITIVTIFAILGLIVMAGFVGNAGHVVTTKIYTQNAADAIAFSSAQWMARGMNAVTATNHLIGETTGLLVAFEALGGPEVTVGLVDYPDEANTIDTANRTLIDLASMIPAVEYGAVPPLPDIDHELVDNLVNKVISPKDEKFHAFATIYDSKFTLKQMTTAVLAAKTVANVALLIPPPFGYPTAPLALAVHIGGDAVLIKIGQEYVSLDILEKMVEGLAKPVTKPLETFVQSLAANGDFLDGKSSVGISAGGPVVAAVGDELERLTSIYHTDNAIFPRPANLRLPIEAEPPPSNKGTQSDEPEWGSDDFIAVKSDDFAQDLPKQKHDQEDALSNRINAYAAGIAQLQAEESDIDTQLAKGDQLSADERKKFQQERTDADTSLKAKQKRMTELSDDLKTEQKKDADSKAAIQNLPAVPNTTGNISALQQHLAKDKMRESEERYTQWVRATYPYVDSYRAPILSQFDSLLGLSQAAKYYRKWTDRYTLTNAWKFRSGFRFAAISDKRGAWQADQAPRLQMYVMKGAFAKSGERRDQKGHETWTADDSNGKHQAEQMFTLIGMTQRDMTPLFSPRVFPLATDDGMTTFAQAIFYNANDQSPDPIGTKAQTQSRVAWDTLNWDPKTPAPEWGAPPHTSSKKWPWELFDGSNSLPAITRVHLNWQAKLMPVTETRFNEAATSDLPNKSMHANLTKAQAFFKQLVTH